MIKHVNTQGIYKTQWMAFYKNGLCGERVVYGESTEEAEKNALIEFRKRCGAVDFRKVRDVVDHVEFLG